jgi:hypothetical protein
MPITLTFELFRRRISKADSHERPASTYPLNVEADVRRDEIDARFLVLLIKLRTAD